MRRLTVGIKRQLSKLKRHKHHPILLKIHKTHKISRKTLFYMKEYGWRSNIASVILKESLFALIIAFAFGALAGISLNAVKSNFVFLLPLVILLPALNDMIGSYSMIMVSRLSTLAFTRRIGRWWDSEHIHKIIRTIFSVAVLSAVYLSIAASLIAYFKGFPLALNSVIKIVEVSLITTLIMVGFVVAISAVGVFYVYKRKEDPNNLVMPIMTSVADLGTILTFALVVRLIF